MNSSGMAIVLYVLQFNPTYCHFQSTIALNVLSIHRLYSFGKPRGKIQTKRSLRQGILSPLFFLRLWGMRRVDWYIFCNERSILKGFDVGSSSLEVTHLQYADDMLIFCPFFAQMMENWWGLIHVFLLVSSLAFNVSKTAVIGVNCLRSEVNFWPSSLAAK